MPARQRRGTGTGLGSAFPNPVPVPFDSGCYDREPRWPGGPSVISSANMAARRPNRLLPSRREFLRFAGLAGLCAAAGIPSRGGSRLRAAPPVFEEIPPSVSGITWVHDNAMSPERYLPETMGPGVAFLDYDNDGWMDIFMVNSGGPADFYTAEGAAEERALQEQPRRHVHRRHRQGRRRRRQGIRHGLRGRRLRQRRLPGHPRDRVRQVHAVPQQRQRHLHRRDRQVGLARARAGRRAPSGSTTTTTASSISSCAASSSSRCKSNVFCGDNKLGTPLLLHPARLQADAERCSSTTTATARSPR